MPIFQKHIFQIKYIIVSLAVLLIFINTSSLFPTIVNTLAEKKQKATEPGSQFLIFKKQLQNAKTAGYLTNKNMSPENNDGLFLEAQYMLAPTVLTLNEPAAQFNILDYTSPVYTVITLRTLEAMPVITNSYGKILAKSKK